MPSPVSGSMRTTSAPYSARISAAIGAATNADMSTTLTPSRSFKSDIARSFHSLRPHARSCFKIMFRGARGSAGAGMSLRPSRPLRMSRVSYLPWKGRVGRFSRNADIASF